MRGTNILHCSCRSVEICILFHHMSSAMVSGLRSRPLIDSSSSLLLPRSRSRRRVVGSQQRWSLSSSSSSSPVSAAAAASESLITVRVYAKEISTSPNHTNVDTTNDCPLCEALVNKCEKFMQAVAYDPASRLNQANLEIVRLPNEHPKAISTPFITICLGNSQEEIQVDRPSPRASAQQVQRVVEKAVLAATAAQQ